MKGRSSAGEKNAKFGVSVSEEVNETVSKTKCLDKSEVIVMTIYDEVVC